MREDVKSGIGKASLGLVILFLAGVAFFLFTLWRWGRFVVSTIKYVVENLSAHSGISANLLFGVVIIATIPFFWAVGKYMHGAWYWLKGVGPGLRLYKSIHGIIIVAYVGLYFLALFFVSRGSIAQKNCVKTPEGIKIYDDPTKDPVYGLQTHPCTFEDSVEIERKIHPDLGPQRVQVTDARTFAFFDPVTHKPLIWYYKNSSGEYEFFNQGGYAPETDAPLKEMDQQAREDAIRVQDERVFAAQQASQQQAVLEQQRERDALAAKYVNTSIVKQAGTKQAAILVFSKDQGQLVSLEEALSQGLLNRGFTPVRSFFKPQFVQDGGAERLFADDWAEVAQLGIKSRVDAVIIGNASISTVDSTQFEQLITTNLNLELKCLDVDHQATCGTRSVNAVGAGFSKIASLQNASEKAQSEIDAFVRALHVD